MGNHHQAQTTTKTKIKGIEQMTREERRCELAKELYQLGPQKVYGALIAHARAIKRLRYPRWVELAFDEIFLRCPRIEGVEYPSRSALVDEWLKLRASTYRAYHERDLTDDEYAAIPPELRDEDRYLGSAYLTALDHV
jgi:hypothetical protein